MKIATKRERERERSAHTRVDGRGGARGRRVPSGTETERRGIENDCT